MAAASSSSSSSSGGTSVATSSSARNGSSFTSASVSDLPVSSVILTFDTSESRLKTLYAFSTA
eukprot:1360443-Prymnesium_polylepis.1